ncbi:MAG TPA: translation elongation factor Ts [Thermodesulfobacteriota bacterium]|nr:translation elongation factor Ts [Thermodesulfobacteriota bacterium]
MEISAQKVKELREKTGAGVMDCKKALSESKGDFEKAVVYLRIKGLAAAKKKEMRQTKEGLVTSYIHAGGKVGVLVEVNCETDFVARNDAFLDLTKGVAMHIAAMSPLYVKREDVPVDIIEKERDIYREGARSSGKPDGVIEKIVEGKLEKFFKEVCLFEQAFVKNPDITVGGLVTETIARVGENIQVGRFARFKVGEGV